MTYIYEHPLNERMRLFMRLEQMLAQMNRFSNALDYYSVQLFLNALFDVLDFLQRYEIRGELIKELQIYKTAIERQQFGEHIHEIAIDELLKLIEENLHFIHQHNSNLLGSLRENELLNHLKQRNFNQSGNCVFEVPAFQYWLQSCASHSRNEFLSNCNELFAPITKAIDLILELVREGAALSEEIGTDGVFLRNIDNKRRNQMVRVHLSDYLDVCPRVSGDKHRVAIRFMRQINPELRAQQVMSENVPFQLQICTV